jgi:hypothetical protein
MIPSTFCGAQRVSVRKVRAATTGRLEVRLTAAERRTSTSTAFSFLLFLPVASRTFDSAICPRVTGACEEDITSANDPGVSGTRERPAAKLDTASDS